MRKVSLVLAEVQCFSFQVLMNYRHRLTVDVLLETNLDVLLLPTTGFVAARHDDGQRKSFHCLWNGLIGSEPGHPFLKRLIEDIVNCCDGTREADTLLFGPCALGRAINSVLGNRPNRHFEPGLSHSRDVGETLILMVRCNGVTAQFSIRSCHSNTALSRFDCHR